MMRLLACAVALLLLPAAVTAIDDRDAERKFKLRAPLTVCTAEWEDFDADCSAFDPAGAAQARGFGARVWRRVAQDLGLEEGEDFMWAAFPGPDGFAAMLADLAERNGSGSCDIAAAAVANTEPRVSEDLAFSAPFLERQPLTVMVADLDQDVALHVARMFPGHRIQYLTALGTPVSTGLFVGSTLAAWCTWSILSCFEVRLDVGLVPASLAAMFIGPAIGLWATRQWTGARLAAVLNPIGVYHLPDLATTDARDAANIGSTALEICTLPTYVEHIEGPDISDLDSTGDYDSDNLPTDCPDRSKKHSWSWFGTYRDEGHLIATARHGWDYDAMLASFVAPLEALADGIQMAPTECRAIAADRSTLASLAHHYDESWAQRYNGTSRRKPVQFRILHGHCTELLGAMNMSFAWNSRNLDAGLQLKINATIQKLTNASAAMCSEDLHTGTGLLRDGDKNLYNLPGVSDLFSAAVMLFVFIGWFGMCTYLCVALSVRLVRGVYMERDVLLLE